MEIKIKERSEKVEKGDLIIFKDKSIGIMMDGDGLFMLKYPNGEDWMRESFSAKEKLDNKEYAMITKSKHWEILA